MGFARPLSVLPFVSLSLVAIATASSGAACSSNPNDTPSRPNCQGLYDPGPTFNATTPQVSLKTDVLPIFIESCSFGTCHGNADLSKNNGIFIGDTVESLPAFVAGAVDKPAGELSSMSFVAKGDPKQSFLMHKVDGDLCLLDARCLGRNCGREMPQGRSAIPLDQRDTIRRWIAQGASNN